MKKFIARLFLILIAAIMTIVLGLFGLVSAGENARILVFMFYLAFLVDHLDDQLVELAEEALKGYRGL